MKKTTVYLTMLCIVALIVPLVAQKLNVSDDQEKRVPPVFYPQQLTCVALNANNAQFPNVTRDSAMIYNTTPPANVTLETFFQTSGNWTNTGPTDLSKKLFMQASHQHGSPYVNGMAFTSQKMIAAVIMKSPSGSNVYAYDAAGVPDDATLETYNNEQIIGIEFCYLPGPTAGNGTISGRVVDTSGRGVSKAEVVLVSAAYGTEAQKALTTPFGYYSFDNIPVGQMYVLVVRHKRLKFKEAMKSVNMTDSIWDLDFETQ